MSRIELEHGLNVEINTKNQTAIVISSPNVTGTVIIPRYATCNGKKYPIVAIGDKAFDDASFDSLIFAEDSEVESFKKSTFFYAEFRKLQIPPQLKNLSSNWCYCASEIVEIEVSPKNKLFTVIDKTFLVKKSNRNFDTLVFCRRDAKNVKIPSCVKTITTYAFDLCNNLISITFDQQSCLENIESDAISNNNALQSIILPPSLKCISNGIQSNYKIQYIEFQSEYFEFSSECFHCCCEGMVISFPNAKKLILNEGSTRLFPEGTRLKVRQGAELVGDEFSKIKSQIEFIKELPQTKKSNTTNKKRSTKKEVDKSEEKGKYELQIARCMKRIRFLESRLGRYEDFIPFNLNSNNSEDDVEYERMNALNEDELDTKKEAEKKNIFIDEEDESYHRVISQIGEGATSTTYKVIDERNGEELCKKVLKADEKKTTFKDFQNIYKEFEVLQGMNHPSICKCIGINPQEKISNNSDQDDDDEIEIKKPLTSSDNKAKTTIAIFLKFHPMNLRECLEKDILNNTLKAKLAVEIAFGMLYIHEHGMIHRDLKLENVMVNYIFEAQLIDFGLVHVDEMKSTMTSMTKGIGTLAYMSPEMQNEEEYDNKTDVYSFGVLLFVLFTRRFPKQSMKDKLNNKPPVFPEPSPAISSFNINLIKKCMSFEANKRPAFDEIVDEMYQNSFKMAEGIDSEIVLHRFRELNTFRSLNKKIKAPAKKSPLLSSNKRKHIIKPNIKPI